MRSSSEFPLGLCLLNRARSAGQFNTTTSMGRLAHLQEPTLLAIHKPLGVALARGLAQLAQGLGLDLPNPFARHRELLADFLQRVLGL